VSERIAHSNEALAELQRHVADGLAKTARTTASSVGPSATG
jgi:hypothetical protein